MANQQHLDILRQGVEIWNHWRKENPSIAVDLREANLVGANLAEADLKWVNLKGADVEGNHIYTHNMAVFCHD